jgi:hypothetical protein
MTTINNGGPAYPFPSTVTPEGYVQPGWHGMTLRDWFASQALAGLLRDGIDVHGIGDSAYLAYEMADAMLVAREVKP